MSEIAIFGFGSILFLMTTWATIAFGLQRMHELQLDDLERTEQVTEIRDDGFIEIHVTEPVIESSVSENA